MPVGVGEIGLQGLDPLGHATLDQVPFEGVEDARHEVERPRPLLAREGIGDPSVGERPGHLVGPEPQFGRVHRLQGSQ